MEDFVWFVDIDDCVNITCSDHGDCIDLVADYWCDCTDGYAGRQCAIGVY